MRRSTLTLVTVAVSGLLAVPAASAGPSAGPDREAVRQALDAGRAAILEREIDGSHWNMPSYLGTHYMSQYYLLLRWLGRTDTRLEPERLRAMLLASQLPDGSWHASHDVNLETGDLNATFLDYFALKAMGEPIDSPPMAAARSFILARGGLPRVSAFNHIVSALFGNFGWDFMSEVPYLLFNENLPLNQDSFAQWVGPHLLPIAYLRNVRASRDLGPAFRLDELWPDQKALAKARARIAKAGREIPGKSEREQIDFILGRQQPKGSFGAYTVSTLLSAVAFADYASFHPEAKERLAEAAEKGFAFVEWMYFDSGESAYRGVLDDGHFWDTALVGGALQEAGVPAARLKAVARYLVHEQSSNGGFGFGVDFWYAPDTDDTAEILLFLRPHLADPEIARSAEVALRWLESMQNDDGGWGAFAKNNDGNALLQYLAGDLSDSADLFDESSPDLAGHILEALGAYGRNRANSKVVRRAIDYLKDHQEPTGAWWSRWGINYLYGTGAAVVGLIRAGEDPRAPYLQRALDWLESRQNADGGFGETSRSYDDPKLAGVGVSTPSQTAWTLLALIDGGRAESPAAKRAAGWLVEEILRDGRWIDRSSVGTGHPGLIYMDYPSYPFAFPLIALARWEKATTPVPADLIAGRALGAARTEALLPGALRARFYGAAELQLRHGSSTSLLR